MTAPPPVDPRRFEAVAASVAGRPLRVVWGEGPTWCDGRTIVLDPTFTSRARDAVVLQSALVVGGALDAEVVRPLRGRSRAAARHLVEAVPRCLAAVDAVLRPDLGGPTGWWGTIRPAKVLALAAAAAAASPAPTGTMYALETIEPSGHDDTTASRTEGRPRTDGWLQPEGRRRRRPRRGATRSEELESEGAGGWAGSRAMARSSPVRLLATDAGPIALDQPPGRPGAVALLPEWDQARGAYRPDWCAVHEVPIDLASARDGGGPASSTDVERALRRRLAALHLDLAHTRRQPQGHDLDLDAVVEHRCLVRSGDAGAPEVFVDSRRRRRDLGVLVLVDASRSTGNGGGPGGTVLAQHQAGAAALVAAFESLGDRVACHAFRSHGRRRVEVLPVKRFDDRFDAAARRRLGALQADGFTRLGAAVRHGADLLSDGAGSRRWLLVVLSDGFPFDLGYEGRHAAADSHRALAEARRAGVGALCLSLGAATPDEDLRAVFGATTFASAQSIAELETDLGGLVRAALDGADRSRRLRSA
ncbi:MAG: hypothetical protein H0W25_01800 [Acidimicrobiia bacterium]|nr:hypothetical protein [Acidimicrobiia bacterium]